MNDEVSKIVPTAECKEVVTPPPTNEYTTDGKCITKVNTPYSLKAVLGFGRSRHYIYFKDEKDRSVVDKEWYEKVVKAVELSAVHYDENRETKDYSVEAKVLSERLEAMTSKAKALQDALTKEEKDNASLKKSLGEMNKAYTELKEKSDLQVLEIEELKIKAETGETNMDSIPPPVAKDEKDMKRLDSMTMQNVRRSQGYSNIGKCSRFCRTCHECEVLDYNNHAIAMRCNVGDFPVGSKSGCNLDTGDGVKRIVLTDEAISRMLKVGTAMKCGNCGKIIGFDEYCVNEGWCAECLDKSYEEYLRHKVKEERAAKMEADRSIRVPFNLPFGGVCEKCSNWHTAKCEKPMNQKNQKCKCYTILVNNLEKKGLEAALSASADGMIRIVEGRKAGNTSVLVDETGDRIVTEYNEAGEPVGKPITNREEGEW